MSRLQRNLAVLSTLVFFALGAMAVSFASAAPSPLGLLTPGKAYGNLEQPLSQSHRHLLDIAAVIEDGQLPNFAREPSGWDRDGGAPVENPGVLAPSGSAFSRKVSIRMLKSVLNL